MRYILKTAFAAVFTTALFGHAVAFQAEGPPDVTTVEITEWEVPWAQTRPRDPFVAEDGRIWFVGQRGDYVANLNPESGDFERFDLNEGAGPHNLIVDAGGMVWYAGNRDRHIGRLNPSTGQITRFDMPDENVRDPHTLVFDQDGNIWFTAQGSNYVGWMNPRTEEIDVVPVPTERARPYGIVVDGQGRPWFNQFANNKIGMINPRTMEITEYELPRASTRDRRIGVTSDGGVWYVDHADGHLGRLDPETGEVTEWATPSGAASRPYAMAVDNRDRIWFVETGVEPNKFVGFDPVAERFFSSTEIESGGGTVRHMYYHEPTGTIWFGTDTNFIGRAVVD